MTVKTVTKNNTKRQKTLFALAIIAGLLAIVATLYFAHTAVWAEIKTMKLSPIPERFTELYFNDYGSLPARTTAKEFVPFSFTIHNLEGVMMTYPYSVYFQYPDQSRVLFGNGTTTIDNNASEIITIGHTFISSRLHGKVIVEILGTNQHIDVLFPNTN